MATPTLIVEFGFTKSGLDYVWNDISSYVRSVDIGRGINREIDNYSAGTANITLSNNNRYFDPTFSSSPYFGQIQPAGAVRVISNGITIYYGFIDSWEFDFPQQGFDSTAVINASDGLANLAKATLDVTVNLPDLTGARINYILNRPEVGWNSALTKIDIGNNVVQGDTISQGTNVLSYIQQVARSESGDIFASRDGLITFKDRGWLDDSYNPITRRYNYCKNPSFEVSGSFWSRGSITSDQAFIGSKSLFVSYDGISASTTNYDETDATKYVGGYSYFVSAYARQSSGSNRDVTVQVQFYNGASLLFDNSNTTTIPSNQWVRVDSGSLTAPAGTNRIIVYIFTGLASGLFYIDGVLIEPVSTISNYFDGSVVLDGLPDYQYYPHWTGIANASASYLDTAVPKTNPTPVTPIALSDYSGTDIPYSNIVTSYNSENLFNRIAISRVFGSTQIKEDTAKQNIYGIRTYSASDYLNNTDAEVATLAGELLSMSVNPEFRAEQVDVLLHSLSNANQNTMLALDLRSLLKVTFKPARTGSQMVKTYVIIGISHTISQKYHSITYNLASIENQPFRLNSSITGVLDTNKLSY